MFYMADIGQTHDMAKPHGDDTQNSIIPQMAWFATKTLIHTKSFNLVAFAPRIYLEISLFELV